MDTLMIGLSSPNHACFPGYYCPSGTVYPDENICPRGFYCPVETSSADQNPCDIGTYNQYEGQPGVEACIPCQGGYYCPNTGMSSYIEFRCEPGYYCPPGTGDYRNVQNECPNGSFCETGSVQPKPCPDGYYTDGPEPNCTPCSAGEVCIQIDGTGATGGQECPAGFYCPGGDVSPLPVPCPRGTLGIGTGLADESDCSDCEPGEYCSYYGATTPTGLCAAGYFCPESRNRSESAEIMPDTPDDLYLCPAHYYCVAGSIEPEPCPEGTFRNEKGGRSEASCQNCGPGKYCPGFGQGPQPCEAGFICENGAKVSDPSAEKDQTADREAEGGYICPAGYYCLSDAVLETPCPAGTYNSQTGGTDDSACEPCDEGFYCPIASVSGSEADNQCGEGYYCESGIVVKKIAKLRNCNIEKLRFLQL